MLEMLSMLPALTLALTNPPNKAGCPRRTALAAVAGSATTLLCGAAPHTAHAAVVGDREVMTTVDLAVKPNQKPISVARRRFTGAGDPAWTYLERDLSAQLYPSDGWPARWPYDGLDDFKRLDEAPCVRCSRTLHLRVSVRLCASARLRRYPSLHPHAHPDRLSPPQ